MEKKIILPLLAVVLLAGCRTVKETSITDHRLTERLESIDSLVRRSLVVSQDSTWRESVRREFQSIREHSDTSHTVVVDTAGQVIRERLIINNYRETASETSSQEREVLISRLTVLDSTVQAQTALIHRLDSTVQTERREVEVPARLSLLQRLRLHTGDAALIMFALFIGYRVIKKRL